MECRTGKRGCCLCNKGGVWTKIRNGLLDARGSLVVLQVTKSCISLQLSDIIWPENSLCKFLAENAVEYSQGIGLNRDHLMHLNLDEVVGSSVGVGEVGLCVWKLKYHRHLGQRGQIGWFGLNSSFLLLLTMGSR